MLNIRVPWDSNRQRFLSYSIPILNGKRSSRVSGDSNSGARPLERCRRIPKTNHEDLEDLKEPRAKGALAAPEVIPQRRCGIHSWHGHRGQVHGGWVRQGSPGISPYAPGSRMCSSARLFPMPVPGVSAKACFRPTIRRNPFCDHRIFGVLEVFEVQEASG
jgi:hypothetical protein